LAHVDLCLQCPQPTRFVAENVNGELTVVALEPAK
jgi:hypothetical protein